MPRPFQRFISLIGAASLIIALFTPMFSSLIPRRILYTVAACFMIFGNLIGLSSLPHAIPIAVLCNSAALVVMTVCFNAYVMDYIDRTSMGKNESSRLLYSAGILGHWAISWGVFDGSLGLLHPLSSRSSLYVVYWLGSGICALGMAR